TVTERTTDGQPKHPGRFPPGTARCTLHTFAEEIELIQGLEHTLGRPIGLYPEVKAPWYHRQHGKEIARAVLDTLQRHGYRKKTDRVFVQCFDPRELERMRRTMSSMAIDLRLVQLMAPTDWHETMIVAADGTLTPYDTAWMFQPGGMKRIAAYADGVGPWLPMVVQPAGEDGHRVTALVQDAHRAGLVVHPYTFRADPGQRPPYAKDFEALVRIFVDEAQVDGLFTDFPDRARRVIEAAERSQPRGSE
ncbi:MAG: glycerophosphodiester phosphodiesterase, partial [Myxococcales bacterium]|nr:glycerophosphodiester phosphodiesterase [Myxococcales bacterium]